MAVLNPNGYCSTMVHGANQSYFGFSHFIPKTKDDRGHCLKVRLVEVLEHSKPTKLFLFTMTEDDETGARHVVKAIHRFVSKRSRSVALPPALFVQVVNCTQENGNRYILAYLELLLLYNILNVAEEGFLPIGHTHRDIKQVFRTVSNLLRNKNVETFSGFQRVSRTSFSGAAEVIRREKIIDWSGLCRKSKVLNKVKSFSPFRVFHFSCAFDNERASVMQCHVKTFCDEEWAPTTRSKGPRYSGAGFLFRLPDLKKKTFRRNSTLHQKAEVARRSGSQKSGVNDYNRIRLLCDLRDHVFNARTE